MTVNVFGVVNATQAFVNLLRTYGPKRPLQARILNISSGAGHVVIPPSGTYSSSKVIIPPFSPLDECSRSNHQFALEGLSDAMRNEFAAWGIHTILVEPGRFKTDFQEKAYIDYQFGGYLLFF